MGLTAVTMTGTPTAITSLPSDEGDRSITFDTVEEAEYEAREGTNDQLEGFQDATLIVAEYARVQAITYSAALELLMRKLTALQQQPQNGQGREDL